MPPPPGSKAPAPPPPAARGARGPSVGGASRAPEFVRENTRPVTVTAEDEEAWIHGKISRDEAGALLKEHAIAKNGIMRDGQYLVRHSAKYKGAYSLSVTFEENFHHYLIERTRNGTEFRISGNRGFPSLAKLVEYHKDKCDGLCTRLRHATLRTGEEAKFRAAGWDIARADVEMGSRLGEGQFGDVVTGTWRGIPCAIKTLKEALVEDKVLVSDFLVEATMMTNLQHEFLVRLYGVCAEPDGPLLIVTELMGKGCLQQHLRRARRQITQAMLLQWARQLASGFAHMERLHFIHRDIACRNVLINNDNTVKIGDFGLARFVQNNEFRARAGQVVAIKWTAPEAIQKEIYNIQTDIWSFGVLLWE